MIEQRHMTQEIRRLVADLPVELVGSLAAALGEAGASDWPALRTGVMSTVAQPDVREQVGRFLDFWQANAPTVSPDSVALSLMAAVQVEEYHRGYQKLELVWTGPDSQPGDSTAPHGPGFAATHQQRSEEAARRQFCRL